VAQRDTQSGLTLTLVGGPTLLIEFGGARLLTDPTFDPAGARYVQGPIEMAKTAGPALGPDGLGRVDAVLLTHDQHRDNLDDAGRAFLPRAGRVLTTASAAGRLGGGAVGLEPWQSFEVAAGDGTGRVRVTAVPARHGPPGSEDFVGEVIGFVLEREGDAKGNGSGDAAREAVYVSGDTVWFEGIEAVARRFRVHTAVLFLGAATFEVTGPWRFTMDAAEAAGAAAALGAERVVPVHCEGWDHYRQTRTDVARAFAAADVGAELLWLEPGRPFTASR